MNDITIEQVIGPIYILGVIAVFAFMLLRGVMRYLVWLARGGNNG